jgi:hypothetical protein
VETVLVWEMVVDPFAEKMSGLLQFKGPRPHNDDCPIETYDPVEGTA